MARSTNVALVALLLTACETTNSENWTGGASTSFNQAERSCGVLADDVEAAENRREFFIGCMGSLGWSPKPDASIDI